MVLPRVVVAARARLRAVRSLGGSGRPAALVVLGWPASVALLAPAAVVPLGRLEAAVVLGRERVAFVGAFAVVSSRWTCWRSLPTVLLTLRRFRRALLSVVSGSLRTSRVPLLTSLRRSLQRLLCGLDGPRERSNASSPAPLAREAPPRTRLRTIARSGIQNQPPFLPVDAMPEVWSDAPLRATRSAHGHRHVAAARPAVGEVVAPVRRCSPSRRMLCWLVAMAAVYALRPYGGTADRLSKLGRHPQRARRAVG